LTTLIAVTWPPETVTIAVAPVPPPPPESVTVGVGSRLPIVQARLSELELKEHEPVDAADEPYVKPNGIGSAKATLVARDGPPFVTTTVQVSAVTSFGFMKCAPNPGLLALSFLKSATSIRFCTEV